MEYCNLAVYIQFGQEYPIAAAAGCVGCASAKTGDDMSMGSRFWFSDNLTPPVSTS